MIIIGIWAITEICIGKNFLQIEKNNHVIYISRGMSVCALMSNE
jgi:hypothetical protein